MAIVAIGLAGLVSTWAAPLGAAAQSDSHGSGRALDEAVRRDDDVRAARKRLQQARAEAAALAQRLDRAAQRFEQARAHRVRLEREAAAVAADVDAAVEAAARARSAFHKAVVASYQQPARSLAAGKAVLESSEGSEALHRAALVDRVVAGQAQRARRLVQQSQRAQRLAQQHRTIQAGMASAQRDARQAAEKLRRASDAAGQRAEQLAGQLAATRRDARQRIEAQRKDRRRRRAARAGQAGDAPGTLPPDAALAAMACPVGQPHGFSDSWHAPRSGGRAHMGVDIFASRGRPILAAADATVRRVWRNNLGGLAIDLVDDRGDRYYYAHLAAAHVSGGQRVTAGQHIADTGNSGNARSTPSHLHWQYHPGDGEAVNPFPLASTLCR